MTLELVSFDKLKAILNLNQALLTDYPVLEDIRESVLAALEAETGRLFESMERTKTIFIGGFPTTVLSLPGLPIASVASVTITYGSTVDVLSSDDYEITDFGLQMYGRFRNVKAVVVYTGGFITAAVPSKIARAAYLQTTYEYQGKSHIGAESVSTDGGTVRRPELGLLKTVKKVLLSEKHPLMLV